MKFLYDLDVISLNEIFSKKIIYEEKLLKLFLKGVSGYFLRLIPIYIFFIMVSFLSFGEGLLSNILNLTLIIMTVIVHEIGHCSMFLYHNQFKKDFYISIDKFTLSIITSKINNKKTKLVAFAGPFLGFLCSTLLFVLISKKLYLFIGICHLSMLLPFFDDGKHISPF